MNSYVVYDIETHSKTHPDSITIPDFNWISIVVTYEKSNGIKVWFEDEVEQLANYLLSFDLIVGFNNNYFDNLILNKYIPGINDRLTKKSLDILELIEKTIGKRVSLNSIAKATLNKTKSATGEDAIKWWRENRKDLVINYCIEDVLITNDIYLFYKQNNYLAYETFGVSNKIIFNKQKLNESPDGPFRFIDDNGIEINLDPQNKEFFNAIELVKKTNDIIYLTGKAGTGKTTFLKYLTRTIEKRTAIVAPTGVAAINAGGQTIHSFFQINPNDPPFIPEDKRLRFTSTNDEFDKTTIYSHFKYNDARREIFQSLEILIIDEISMVRADTLDVIDKLLRAFSRRGRNKPFGGIQVIMIGDVFQLPPIEGKEWKVKLSEYYDGPFFFNSLVLKKIKPIYIELKQIYRQKETHFIDLLNKVRKNQISIEDIDKLNQRVRPFNLSSFDDKYIALCSTNEPAKKINQSMLQRLIDNEINFIAIVSGDFPQSNFPLDYNLSLKKGV